MKKIKRLLSILLVCCLMMGLLSTLALSEAQDYVWLDELQIKDSDRYTGNMGDSFIDKIGTRNGTVDLEGNSYSHGLEAWIARWNYKNESSWAWCTYDLNGAYEILSGTIGILAGSYNTTNFDTTIEILGDDSLLYSFVLYPNMANQNIILNVAGVDKLKISLYDNTSVSGGTSFSLGDFRLYYNSAGQDNRTGPDNSKVKNSGTCGDNLTWKLDTDGTLTISGTGAMTNYDNGGASFPPWYSQRDEITAVFIGKGITTIGNFAFYNCNNLAGITISNSVTSIGDFAFSDCSDLTIVTIPNSVTMIGKGIFRDCSSLNSITIPNSITTIEEYAFFWCDNLTSVTIPNSVTNIRDRVFWYCSNLTDIYYDGSEGQWKQIKIVEDGNDSLLNATIHYNNGGLDDNSSISNEIILKAKILQNNDSFHYYTHIFRSPATLLNNEQKKGNLKSLSRAYLYVNDFVNILLLKFENGENLDTTKYYEAILADIMENDSNGLWDEIYSTWKTTNSTYNNKIVQKVFGQVKKLDSVKTSDFFQENDKSFVFDTIIDYSDKQGILKNVTIDYDFFNRLSLSVNLAGDFFDAVNEALAYSAVQQEKIDVLKDLQARTDNRYLKSACASLIKDIQFAHENTLAYFAGNWADETIKDIFEFSHSMVVGLVLKYITTNTAGVTPYVPGLSEAREILKTGQFITNTIICADGAAKNVLTVAAYAGIEEELKKLIDNAEDAFGNSMTVDNAMTFISYADFYKATLLQSCDIYTNYVRTVQKSARNQKWVTVIGDIFSGNLVDFVKTISEKDYSFEEALELAKRIKRYIGEADFYSKIGDIAEFITNITSTTPSKWAEEYVDKAIRYNILAEYMRGNYQSDITRAEFCTLLFFMINGKTGSIDALMEQHNYKTDLFEDTYYEYVYYMARLGIVSGVSETEFNPLGKISRQEAATMLFRTANVLGYDTSAPETNFSSVADWARDGVNFVVSRNIMTGTNNGFEPQGTYTKEQAITTMVRFYENLG